MGTEIAVSKTLMGCPFTFIIYPKQGSTADDNINKINIAISEISRIENLLTDFRSSELSKINDMAGISPVKVSDELFNLIELSLKISDETDGAFDISFSPLGMLWREAFHTKIPPNESDIENAKKLIGYKKIAVNYKTKEIFLPTKGMRISMCGIGKGYAVDKAYSVLRELGVSNFLINGAGDIRVHTNEEAKRSWRIAIRNPFSDNYKSCGYLSISQGAIATSGNYERYFKYRGKRYHHIIDARDGCIPQEIVSSTVISNSAMTADIYATVMLILGENEAKELFKRKRNLYGVMIKSDGSVIRPS